MAGSNSGLGSISFLINVASGETVDDEVLADARQAVATMFTEGLKRYELDGIIEIQAVECRRGCIMIDIVIGGGAALLMLRDYDKYRNSLILLVKDLNGAWAGLKKWVSAGCGCFAMICRGLTPTVSDSTRRYPVRQRYDAAPPPSRRRGTRHHFS